jgi:hypothetical protein
MISDAPLPAITTTERMLLDWVAPTERTGDEAADKKRAVDRELAALPSVRSLIDAIEYRESVSAALPMLEPGMVTMDKGRKRLRVAEANADELIELALRAGLEARIGLYLRGDEGLLFDLLRLRSKVSSQLPRGLCVCERCGLVFEPSGRKTYARLCRHCRKRPHGQAPFSCRQLDDGGFRVAGAWGTYYMQMCATCESPFEARRKDAALCPDCQRHKKARGTAIRSRPA